MYASRNFKTKKQFKEAVHGGEFVTLNPQGLETTIENGREAVCGPWYPKPHTWYASVTVKDGRIREVK